MNAVVLFHPGDSLNKYYALCVTVSPNRLVTATLNGQLANPVSDEITIRGCGPTYRQLIHVLCTPFRTCKWYKCTWTKPVKTFSYQNFITTHRLTRIFSAFSEFHSLERVFLSPWRNIQRISLNRTKLEPISWLLSHYKQFTELYTDTNYRNDDLFENRRFTLMHAKNANVHGRFL